MARGTKLSFGGDSGSHSVGLVVVRLVFPLWLWLAGAGTKARALLSLLPAHAHFLFRHFSLSWLCYCSFSLSSSFFHSDIFSCHKLSINIGGTNTAQVPSQSHALCGERVIPSSHTLRIQAPLPTESSTSGRWASFFPGLRPSAIVIV